MPLTAFQQGIAQLLATNRTPDSHLAGGAALHFSPHSKRCSNDLDFFHDSVERVAVRHFGTPGGVLPQLYDGDALAAAWRAEPAPVDA